MGSEQDAAEWPKHQENVVYSDKSILNTLEWYIDRPASEKHAQSLWVIYIHGGAWRDPEIDASSFRPTRDILLGGTDMKYVRGIASINYRLSPYPQHPRNPSSNGDPSRNALHPDHIDDVFDALTYLQERFQFGHDYLLVGHSCGATLALQTAVISTPSTTNPSNSSPSKFDSPLAILGVAGIYDLPALIKYHHDQAVYENFIINAFGDDANVWGNVSPARTDYKRTWPGLKLVLLAHSHEDGLVEWEQAQLQHDSLTTQGFDQDGSRRVHLVEVQGGHDEIWQKATELARVIQLAVSHALRFAKQTS